MELLILNRNGKLRGGICIRGKGRILQQTVYVVNVWLVRFLAVSILLIVLFLLQNAMLRRKLQSKTEAVLILSKDLNKCRNERDQFKLLVDELQHKLASIKRNVHNKVMRA